MRNGHRVEQGVTATSFKSTIRAPGAFCDDVFMGECAGERKDLRESITLVICYSFIHPP